MDPYHEWLSIPPEDQPPDHYRLLGLKRFENSATVIANAADRQMLLVRTYQIGTYADIAQKLMREITSAKLVLLDPASRDAYNRELTARREPPPPPAFTPTAPAAVPSSSPPSPPPTIGLGEPVAQPPKLDLGGRPSAAFQEIPTVFDERPRLATPPKAKRAVSAYRPRKRGVSGLVWLIGGAAAAGLLLVVAVALTLQPAAPRFTFRQPAESPIKFREGQLGHASVQIAEHQRWRRRLRYVIESGPESAAVTERDGLFSWTPGEKDGGKTHRVTIRVEARADGEVHLGRHTYEIYVEEVNQPPRFLPLPGPLRAAPGERFGHTFSADDPDMHGDGSKDKLTWKLLSGDFPGHTWNEREGTLIWTPHPAYEGPPITGEVDVEDGRGGRDSLVFTVEVLR